MVRVAFHPDAEVELERSVHFYKEIVPDLGRDFRKRVERAVQAISKNPDRWPLQQAGYRRYNLTRFPFYLPYIEREGIIWILAVAHGKRMPEYWNKRAGKQSDNASRKAENRRPDLRNQR